MLKLLVRLANDRSGATMVEYGLMAALVTGAVIVGIGMIGGSLADIFTSVGGNMAAAAASAASQ